MDRFIGLLWGVVICIVISLCSCTTTKIVEVPKIEKEYVSIFDTTQIHDTTVVRDSIIIRQQGDTIFTDRWHNKYIVKYQDRVHYKDSVRIDTIYKTITIETKEKRTLIDRIADKIGYVIGFAIICGVCLTLLRYIKK